MDLKLVCALLVIVSFSSSARTDPDDEKPLRLVWTKAADWLLTDTDQLAVDPLRRAVVALCEQHGRRQLVVRPLDGGSARISVPFRVDGSVDVQVVRSAGGPVMLAFTTTSSLAQVGEHMLSLCPDEGSARSYALRVDLGGSAPQAWALPKGVWVSDLVATPSSSILAIGAVEDAGESHGMVCLLEPSGRIRWMHRVKEPGSRLRRGAVIGEDVACVGKVTTANSESGLVLLMNLETGRVERSREGVGPLLSVAATDSGIFVGGRTRWETDKWQGHVARLDREDLTVEASVIIGSGGWEDAALDVFPHGSRVAVVAVTNGSKVLADGSSSHIRTAEVVLLDAVHLGVLGSLGLWDEIRSRVVDRGF